MACSNSFFLKVGTSQLVCLLSSARWRHNLGALCKTAWPMARFDSVAAQRKCTVFLRLCNTLSSRFFQGRVRTKLLDQQSSWGLHLICEPCIMFLRRKKRCSMGWEQAKSSKYTNSPVSVPNHPITICINKHVIY